MALGADSGVARDSCRVGWYGAVEVVVKEGNERDDVKVVSGGPRLGRGGGTAYGECGWCPLGGSGGPIAGVYPAAPGCGDGLLGRGGGGRDITQWNNNK